MAKKEVSKKVIAVKLMLILSLALVLGISCLFSSQIENFLNIGNKTGNYVASEVIQKAELKVHYVDVGQADCTIIELPDGSVMMIDAGTSSSAKHIIRYTKDLGIDNIDYFVLTHSDSDHSGGAKAIFNAFEIKKVYRPFQIAVEKETMDPIESEDLGEYYKNNPNDCNVVETSVYQNFIKAAYSETYTENGEKKSAEVCVSYDGLKITPNSMSTYFMIEFFAPLKKSTGVAPLSDVALHTSGYPTKIYGNGTSESKNNSSPIILIEYGENSFMFSGDANEDVEKDVIASLSESEKQRFSDVDVFQAGHHGSASSNCEEFLQLITPEYVVASAGAKNKYNHPTPQFIERVNNLPHSVNDYLLRTDKIGDIVVGVLPNGTIAYTAKDSGDSYVVVYWWEIALGTFVCLSLVILFTKVTKNKTATAKRAVKNTKKVMNSMNKK